MIPSTWGPLDYICMVGVGFCFGIGLWLARVIESALKKG
jgi:hypothetical protein